jgi:dienelactone hydrolase
LRWQSNELRKAGMNGNVPNMSDFQPFQLSHNDADLIGQMIMPEGVGPFPTVMVMASAYGLGDHVFKIARRLAALGYVAVATDMYGGGAYYPDPSQAGQPFAEIMSSPERIRARTIAWFDAVRAHPNVDAARVAAIGYCFGGMCVLELARSGADAKVVVSFHGVLTTQRPMTAGAFKGEVAAYCGAKDPFAPIEHIDGLCAELAAAGAHYDITVFGEAEHSFTDPDAANSGRAGIAYHKLSDRMSWAGTVALLDAALVS